MSTPRCIGLRYPFEVNLVGDAAATLQRLIPLLTRKDDRVVARHGREERARWWEVMDRRADVSADPINPERVFDELSPRLPDNAMLTADSGSGTNWYARHVKIRGTDARHAVRQPGHHGLRRSVCDRRQVRLPESARVSRWSATAPCR